MTPRNTRLVMALSLGLAVSPVEASTPPDSETIVVTGTRMTREAARALSRAYAGEVLARPPSGQNARWGDPLCIGAVGIRASTAVPLIDRMEAVATRAGVRLAGRNCRPNVVLMFTQDGDRAFAEIEARRPDLLAATGIDERRVLRTPGQPVRWFHGQTIEGLGGRPTGADAPALFGTAGALPDGLAVLNEGGASRIGSPTVQTLTGATLLIDVPRAAGVGLDVLGDYLAFVVLTKPRRGLVPGQPSILGLFARSPETATPIPTGLSAFDEAFLGALYAVPINRSAAVNRGLIAEDMVNRLSAPGPEAPEAPEQPASPPAP